MNNTKKILISSRRDFDLYASMMKHHAFFKKYKISEKLLMELVAEDAAKRMATVGAN